MTQIDFSNLTETERYKLLVNTVIPRPIALVSSMSSDGILNAAPFSFFNVFGGTPSTVVLGIGAPSNLPKDTSKNIYETGEFVVNLVSEEMAHPMNITAASFTSDINEIEIAGLTLGQSTHIKTPYIQESPVSFECKLSTGLDLGHHRQLVIGEILCMHIREDLIDLERLRIQTDGLNLIGRIHGRGGYIKTSESTFEMPRFTDAQIPDLIEAAKTNKQ